jgi:alpha-1,3-mannosyltransferase
MKWSSFQDQNMVRPFSLQEPPPNFSTVWCWGWDKPGAIQGPDVEPVWEKMSNRSTHPDAIVVRHHRGF